MFLQKPYVSYVLTEEPYISYVLTEKPYVSFLFTEEPYISYVLTKEPYISNVLTKEPYICALGRSDKKHRRGSVVCGELGGRDVMDVCDLRFFLGGGRLVLLYVLLFCQTTGLIR